MAHVSDPGNISVANVYLTTPDHETIMLGDRIEVPTVVILARYYG